RWTRLRNIGWVWVPGDEWAPAWVSWRKSNDYVGWAPLPPEARFDRGTGIHNWSDSYYDVGPDQYCFVETKQFGAPRLENAVIPSARNVTIVNQTTNVTNITYDNTTIVNQGPSYDEIRTRTQQPIERLRLEREVNININVGEPRPVVRGQAIVIPAPLIARGQAVEHPRRVKETIANVVVDRGWENTGDRQATEKVRVKMKAEATTPPNAPPKTFVKPTEAAAETSATSASSTSSPATAATAAASQTLSPTSQRSPVERSRSRPKPSSTPAAMESASPSPSVTPIPRAERPRPIVQPSASPSPNSSASPTPNSSITLTDLS